MGTPPRVRTWKPPPGAGGLTPPSRRQDLRRIGDVIVDLGFATREAVERAVVAAREEGTTTGRALLDNGTVTAAQLARAVAQRYGVEHVDLKGAQVDPAAAALVDAAVLRRYRAVPFAFADERTLLVATADPGDVLAMDDLTMITGYDIRRAVATPDDVEALLSRLDGLGAEVLEVDGGDEERRRRPSSCASRPRRPGRQARALDHRERRRARRLGRPSRLLRGADARPFRVDGIVLDVTTVTRPMVAGLVSRIKIMAGLDIAERRAPQDGRMGLTVEGKYGWSARSATARRPRSRSSPP